MGALRFRKKPVVIEAWQNTADEVTRPLPPKWILEALSNSAHGGITPLHTGELVIHTLEGRMTCDVGDWIIQGVKGELYPCKPDIFEATYEPVIGSEYAGGDS